MVNFRDEKYEPQVFLTGRFQSKDVKDNRSENSPDTSPHLWASTATDYMTSSCSHQKVTHNQLLGNTRTNEPGQISGNIEPTNSNQLLGGIKQKGNRKKKRVVSVAPDYTKIIHGDLQDRRGADVNQNRIESTSKPLRGASFDLQRALGHVASITPSLETKRERMKSRLLEIMSGNPNFNETNMLSSNPLDR